MNTYSSAIQNAPSPVPTDTSVVTDKRGYAKRWHFSIRHIDNLLAKGMPHLKIGSRRVRIIIAEADKWMHEQYGTRRRRPAKVTGPKDQS
jgi:hypothetical protein